MAHAFWSESAPREELRALSTAQVLGLVLRPRDRPLGESLAAAALARAGSLAVLAQRSPFELARMPGLAVADAVRLAAALELGRRSAHGLDVPRVLRDSAAVHRLARELFADVVHEELWVLAVDAQQRVRASGCVARGGLHGLQVAVRDPLRFALRHGASAMIVVHNHPSGDPAPSPEDVAFTERLADAADAVGTPLLDHVIVAGARFRSLLDEGLIGRRARAGPASADGRALGSRSEAPRSVPRPRAESAPCGAPSGARAPDRAARE
jgi:DNA repair protein RadC